MEEVKEGSGSLRSPGPSGRVLKFRAWDPINNRMYKDPFIAFESDGTHEAYEDSREWEDSIRRGSILMQFTGLQDKNDRDIYEGDICRMVVRDSEGGGWYSDHAAQGVVYFDPHWGMKFDCKDKTQRTASSWGEVNPRDCQKVEVIGNIYEGTP